MFNEAPAHRRHRPVRRVRPVALLLCLFTADNDALFLPLALSSAVIANVTDRCAEKQLQKGEAHD